MAPIFDTPSFSSPGGRRIFEKMGHDWKISAVIAIEI